MEGFWSHFKLMVDGVYHHISIAYLQRYVDEECFRWNTKHLKSGARFEIVFGACLGKFTYDDVKSVVRNVA
ncbi:MAG: transposase [Prevotellaceae bacterium]|nr:transposase [Candidatus Colivivens equi]